MNKNRILILIVILLCTSFISYGQKRKSSVSDKNWGIGLRLGDPTGLTVKKYLGKNALEFSVGKGYMFYGNGWYDRRYHDWYTDWHEDHRYYKEAYTYGYSKSFPFALQVHYLFHNDFKPVDGLQWYWGIGGQFRYQTFKYRYRYKYEGNPNWYYGEDKFSNLDLGLDGVFGAEYNIPNVPISVFADVTLFTEIADDPFRFWFMGGIGARYNFK